jgi:hypothetical protein
MQAGFRTLAPAHRAFLLIVLLPVALWLGTSYHLVSFFDFVVNRSSEAPLLSAWTFSYYPAEFVREFSPPPLLGVMLLLLCLPALWLARRLTPAQRILPLALACDVVLILAHRFKSTRFLFNIAPLVWLCAALTIAQTLQWLSRTWSEGARERVAAALAGGVLVVALITGFDPAAAEAKFDYWTLPGGTRRVLDAIAEANLGSRGTLLLGSWNLLSTGLVEWDQSLLRPRALTSARPKNPLWYGVGLDAAPLARAIYSDRDIERVLVVTLRPGASAYREGYPEEMAWLPAVRESLERDVQWVRESDRTYSDTGYELEVFRRATP